MKFIDRITIDLPNKSAEAKYFVRSDAEFLADHFPNTPMRPGLVMLEIAVQTAAAWLTENLNGQAKASFDLNSLERLYVTRRVTPNETLVVQVLISELAPGGESACCEARAKVAGENAMRAKFHLRSWA
ncbi:MAG: 3-hydroxyacyl-ACP dehydratase FabZ family protein [Pyrinomonadaceae bacterium]